MHYVLLHVVVRLAPKVIRRFVMLKIGICSSFWNDMTASSFSQIAATALLWNIKRTHLHAHNTQEENDIKYGEGVSWRRHMCVVWYRYMQCIDLLFACVFSERCHRNLPKKKNRTLSSLNETSLARLPLHIVAPEPNGGEAIRVRENSINHHGFFQYS